MTVTTEESRFRGQSGVCTGLEENAVKPVWSFVVPVAFQKFPRDCVPGAKNKDKWCSHDSRQCDHTRKDALVCLISLGQNHKGASSFHTPIYFKKEKAHTLSVLVHSNTFHMLCTLPSDQFQISLYRSPEISHHTVRRTWLFIAYSDERRLYHSNFGYVTFMHFSL